MYSTNTGGPSVVHEGVCCCGGPHIWIGTKNSKEECARAVQADSRCKKHETGQFFSYKDMNRADENYRLCGCPTGDDMDCSQENMWHGQPGVTRIYRLDGAAAQKAVARKRLAEQAAGQNIESGAVCLCAC